MRYDRDGFPIPPDFDPLPYAEDGRSAAPPLPGGPAANWAPAPRRRAGGLKRSLIISLLLLGLPPAILGPENVMKGIRMAVVRWSLDRAQEMEAEDDVGGALVEVNRAVEWLGEDDATLLCYRAWLRLYTGDAPGAIDDASRAAAIAPLALPPLRVRGLASVVSGDVEQALADATTVVDRSAPGDPDALNHRAYVRALVGRKLPEALADIDAALATVDEPASAELLDTRGFILHLLGRDQEALEQMNEAIEGMLQQRRRVRFAGDDGVIAKLRLRTIEQGLAVMFQHRGLICAKVGHEEQARQDLAKAQAMGYDPQRGVF
ncbi:MAG: hypothetical protein ACOYK7_14440 [Pirellulales bacterium]